MSRPITNQTLLRLFSRSVFIVYPSKYERVGWSFGRLLGSHFGFLTTLGEDSFGELTSGDKSKCLSKELGLTRG